MVFKEYFFSKVIFVFKIGIYKIFMVILEVNFILFMLVIDCKLIIKFIFLKWK